MKHIAKEVDFKLLNITSWAFNENESIQVKYTCDGADLNPPLNIGNIPEEATSLAIIVDDPDAPLQTWVHWVMWNIPVTHYIKENEAHGIQGLNDFGKNKYCGPCPPNGTHHYNFKVYALDCTLSIPVTSTKSDLEKEMSGHIIAFGQLTGLYSRQK